MKPHLLKVPHSSDYSFSIRKDMMPNINNNWHFHKEIELIHFHRGQGTQFIGDHIKFFERGDIVLVGSNLPHYWKYDESCFTIEKDNRPYSTVLHFEENFLGEKFLHLPEAKVIKVLLEKAKRGILIKGTTGKKTADLIEKIYVSKGLNRIIAALECLLAIADTKEKILLSSLGFKYDFADFEQERINEVYNFSMLNFSRKIYLEEISAIAKMAPNSFCRYFKVKTGKTYSQFLSEIRIGYSCKLLLDNRKSLKQICYESGFNNFSCFHKKFKTITGKTPQNYLSHYMKGDR